MQNSTLYMQRLRQLLQMEYDNEKEEFRVQSEKMDIKRKIHRGICWYPVEAGRSYYNSLNQLVVEIVKKDHDESDEDIEHSSSPSPRPSHISPFHRWFPTWMVTEWW